MRKTKQNLPPGYGDSSLGPLSWLFNQYRMASKNPKIQLPPQVIHELRRQEIKPDRHVFQSSQMTVRFDRQVTYVGRA